MLLPSRREGQSTVHKISEAGAYPRPTRRGQLAEQQGKMAASFVHCGAETFCWGTVAAAILDGGRHLYSRDGLRPRKTCRSRNVSGEAEVTVNNTSDPLKS